MFPGDIPETPGADPRCPTLLEVLTRIGDKWSLCVIGRLEQGPMRFNQLRRSISGVSQRMLTLTLRGLERDGLIQRTVFPTNPPSVEYRLTDLGRTLLEPVQAMFVWAETHRPHIQQARLQFDAGQPVALQDG